MTNQHQILPFRIQQETESSIDLTPLIDINFILLIFFIVTATFIHELGVDVASPPAVQNTQVESKNIAIRIEDSNRTTLNGLEVNIENIAPRITQVLAKNPDAGIVVLVAPGSKANTLVKVIDAARVAGFIKVPVSELK